MQQPDDINTLSYEAALGQLDALIDKLERGSIPLEEAIAAYELGAKLAKHCAALLDRTERRVNKQVYSPGGLKVDATLDLFCDYCVGRECLYAGASNVGFTDGLLSRGAARVYAVDVGRGQLDSRLARSPAVVVMDRTNLRTLTAVPGPSPDLVALDLSFISLRLVLPAVAHLIATDRPADVIALYKPQFELGRDAVGRGGVVRDEQRGAAGAVE